MSLIAPLREVYHERRRSRIRNARRSLSLSWGGSPRPTATLNVSMVQTLESRQLMTAIVLTNQDDYAPGSTALFTATNDAAAGTDFAPGETVRFQVTRTDGIPDYADGNLPWEVTDGVGGFDPYQDAATGMWVRPDTDGAEDGSIATSWYVEPQYANSALLLTATGQTSGAVAMKAFTDSTATPSWTSGYPTATSPTKIDLSWTEGSSTPTPDGFYILRSTGGGTFTTLNPSAPILYSRNVSTYTFQDSTVNPGTTYSYKVQAYKSNGNSNQTSESLPATTTTPSKASQVITFDTITGKTYGDADFALTATGGGSGNGVTFTASGNITIAQVNGVWVVHITGAGSGTIVAQQAGNSTYTAAADVTQSFKIAPKVLTALITASEKVYDGTLAATISGRALVGVIGTDAVTLIGGTAIFADANAATAKTVIATDLSLSGAAAGNYILAPNTLTATANITKANQTITWAAPAAITYGTALSPVQLNASAAGISGGTAAGALTYSPAAGAVLNAGSTTLTVTAAATTNYNQAIKSVSLTVNKAPLTVTAASGSIYYGQAIPAATGTLNGVVNNDAITASYVNTATAASGVGSYAVTPTLDPNGRLSNYTVSSIPGTLTIAAAPTAVTLTSSQSSSTYGDSVRFTAAVATTASNDAAVPIGAVQFFVDGTAFGSPVTLTNGAATSPAISTLTAAAHSITAQFINSNGNFAASTAVPFNQSVAKADPTLAITWAGGTYTGNAFTATATAAGVGGSPLATPTLTYYAGTTPLAGAPVDAGTYTVQAHLDATANYKAADLAKSITIAKATSSVVATGGSFTYDGTTHAGGSAVVSGAGAIDANAATLSYSGDRVNAGSYTVTATYAGDANHDGSTDSATITIEQRALTVTASNASKVYGQANPALTGTLTGVVNGDGITASYVTAATAASGVGTYAIAPDLADPNNKLANYTVASTPATLTVTPAALTITASNLTKIYGNTITFAGTEFTTNGLVNSDVVTKVTLSSPGAAAGAVVTGSPYAIAVANAVGSGLSNYAIRYVPGSLTVTKRDALASYIGQTSVATSGSSSTSAQVTLSASIVDPTGNGFGTVTSATVSFYDKISGKNLATNVPVSLVKNTDTSIGTANTIVTLSSGQYGAQSYDIQVIVNGSFTATTSDVMVSVVQPGVTNSLRGAGSLDNLPTSAGTFAARNGTPASYSFALNYNKSGANAQGQIQVIIPQDDGSTIYIKSNSITSVLINASTGIASVYTKASIYRLLADGTTVSIAGNVSLQMDVKDGASSSTSDEVGFTVLSSQTSELYYSTNWVFDVTTNSWRTVRRSVSSSTGVNGVVIK